MTDLFSPRRPDGRAEWRVVYDATVDLPYGTDVPFEKITELLETDDRARAHRAVRRCNRQFITDNKPRILGNVRSVGYRILQPGEYAPAAMAYQVQARRKMSSAVDLMRTAPLTDMSPTQRDWAHKVYMVLVDNELRLRSQEQWQSDAEKRLAELERRMGIPPVVIDGEIEDLTRQPRPRLANPGLTDPGLSRPTLAPTARRTPRHTSPNAQTSHAPGAERRSQFMNAHVASVAATSGP